MPAENEKTKAKQAVEKLPASIRVHVYDITIVRMDIHAVLASRRWGEFSPAEMEIRIQHDMPTRIKAADTFLHELSHAIFWAYGVLDTDNEERTVAITASGWAAVYRDNPWLLDWLKENLT